MANRYSKLLIALQNYLHGARYYEALKALDFAKAIHVGTRKDGITPEFQHQVEIALYITTLRNLIDEEGCIVAAILHDVLEDYPHITKSDVGQLTNEQRTFAVVLLSKEIGGEPIHFTGTTLDTYFENISRCDIASVVKGSDRIHNLQSMHGVFTPAKQRQYIDETKQYFLPMLKRAAGKFPSQYLAYMNMRTVIKNQVELIESALEGTARDD